MGEKIILSKGGGAETVPMTVTLTASNGANLFGQTVTVTEIGTGEVFDTIQYLGPAAHKITLQVPVHLYYRVSVDDLKGYKTPAPVEGTARKDTPIEITFRYLFGTRYGFRRTIAAADPYARIEYLYDAEGKIPFTMDFANGTPSYGDWEEFINEVATPVMLKYDGTEDYELDRSDQTKKANGEASDISNINYAGNAMVRFEKWKWVHRSEDETYQYVIFSDVQYDDTYHAYAHTDENGEVQDRFYWGMYKGSVDSSSRIRSMAGIGPTTTLNDSGDAARALNNGPGYGIGYKSGWDYICDLLTLISKHDNGQDCFGYGYGAGASGNIMSVQSGSTKAMCGFYGAGNFASSVKAFWIENQWGHQNEAIRGLVCDHGDIKVKMTPPYDAYGTGYYSTGKRPEGTSGGYLSKLSCTDLGGNVPYGSNGSAGTYHCDAFWYDTAVNGYAYVGGDARYQAQLGPRECTIGIPCPGTNGDVHFGVRLSYIPTPQ